MFNVLETKCDWDKYAVCVLKLKVTETKCNGDILLVSWSFNVTETKCRCCHADTDSADQTCYLTKSHCADTGPTSLSTDPVTTGVWQGSH